MSKETFISVYASSLRLHGILHLLSEGHSPLLPELFDFVSPSPSVLAFDLGAGEDDRPFADVNCSLAVNCENTTLTSLTCTRAFFPVRLAQGSRLKCLVLQHVCARHLKKKCPHCSHAMCRTLLDAPFTAPSQSPSTSSSPLFPSQIGPPLKLHCLADLLNNLLSLVVSPTLCYMKQSLMR